MNNKIFLLLAALFPASILTVGETIKLVPEQIPGKPKADFNAPSAGYGSSSVQAGSSVTLTLSVDSKILGLTADLNCGDGLTFTNYSCSVSGWSILVNQNHFSVYGTNSASGGIITVTVTRAAPSETDVSVGKFLELSNGRVLFLIQAASQTTLPAGKDLYYSGHAMFWSQEYGSFVYLAEGASSTTAAADDAASLITVGSTGHTTVERYGDANGSGTVDINDAQYIYDLCSHQTAPTLAARSDIAQLLCADVNYNG